MKYLSDFLSVFVSVALCTFHAGCTDDIDSAFSDELSEGESEIGCEIVFEPMASALEGMTTRATNTPDGKAVSGLEDLCVVIYDTNGNLVDNGIRKIDNLKPEDVDRTGDQWAETTTKQAKFTLGKVPYGTYYLFAVANLGKEKSSLYSEATTTYEELTGRYRTDVQTVAGLKAIRLTWDPERIGNNAEMLGYFTEGSASGTPAALENAAPIRIDRDNMALHSWLRRAASKVTIEYDPSGLRDNIRIFLKSARLRHIPLHCPLGDKNVPASGDDLVSEQDETLSDYYHIDYYPAGSENDYRQWMVLARGGILDGESNSPVGEYDGQHTETAKALYFYENMQGKGKDKSQDADGNGELDYPGKNTDPSDEGYKDKKPYGTFVEVEGFYVSNAPGNYGSGRIVYRFMLGKNVFDDYDAERNHHYKLTMRFRGNANDVDWHIDYTPESDILYAPDPYYISYLYGQTMNLPLYISGKLKPGDYVEIKVKENGWGPADDVVRNEMYPVALEPIAAGPWNGFLALAPISSPTLSDPAGGNYKSTYNKTYWEAHPELSYKKIGYEELLKNVESEGVMLVPLYTREKQLVSTTGFTANNIYPQYMRKAVITVGGLVGGVKVEEKHIRIMQVRRIINPSGVFRSHENDSAFEVTMCYRESPQATTFKPLHSMGPWEARITTGSGWEIVDAVNGVISDDDGSEITFSVKPTQKIGSSEVRCAIAEVRYNNKTCIHRILLRQGDAPIPIVDGGSSWYYYNLRTRNELVEEPMDEGSMFRHGNIGQPISSSNFTPEWVGVDGGSRYFKIEGDRDAQWGEIGSDSDAAGFSNATILGGEAIVARLEDFQLLQSSTATDYKYGILYGDKATKTQMDATDAFGYRRGDDLSNGIRGCFVYNHTDGRSIFLPVGNTGMGRIKHSLNEGNRRGVLRYANRSHTTKWPYSNYAPIFHDIHDSQGAIYWVYKGLDNSAWDINFRTFDFNSFANNALSYGSDAAYIRCVVKSSVPDLK